MMLIQVLLIIVFQRCQREGQLTTILLIVI